MMKTVPVSRHWLPTLSIGAAALILAGCASPRLDAQWSDANRPASSLKGSKVLVACAAYEPVLQRICVDRFTAEIVARGATAVSPPDASVTPGPPQSAEAYAAAARDAGATAVLSAAITTAASEVSQGVSLGIGGFGFGSGGGGGIGVSAPVGGGQVKTGYAANGRLIDAASGHLMWTAKASTPPSNDVDAQLGTLAKLLLDSAEKSGLF